MEQRLGMHILFSNWDTTHSGKSGSQRWAADILQAVVEEELPMKKALRHAFKDKTRKENLLTYVHLPLTYLFVHHSILL